MAIDLSNVQGPQGTVKFIGMIGPPKAEKCQTQS